MPSPGAGPSSNAVRGRRRPWRGSRRRAGAGPAGVSVRRAIIGVMTTTPVPDDAVPLTADPGDGGHDTVAVAGEYGVRHLVWDWNGTLFDDFALVVEATDESLRQLGLPGVTEARYRELYCRPLTDFYARIAGRALDEDEWRAADHGFHALYEARMRRCGLAVDALRLLEAWSAGGRTQSLLSMWGHEELTAFTAELGIARRFARVDGSLGARGGSKRDGLVRHLAALREIGIAPEPASVALIGDSLDDAHAAAAVGARCVLVATGGLAVAAANEAAGGVPVVADLAAAVRLLTVA